MSGRTPGLSITVRQVTQPEILPLRQRVLRPGRPIESAVFSGDELETTSHWAALTSDGQIGAVASLYLAPKPETTQLAWQLRGMASLPELRGQGYGAAVLKACIEWARATTAADHTEASTQLPSEIWCNARSSAVGFYQAHGFVTEGHEFEIPGVGPHFVMSRPLNS